MTGIIGPCVQFVKTEIADVGLASPTALGNPAWRGGRTGQISSLEFGQSLPLLHSMLRMLLSARQEAVFARLRDLNPFAEPAPVTAVQAGLSNRGNKASRDSNDDGGCHSLARYFCFKAEFRRPHLVRNSCVTAVRELTSQQSADLSLCWRLVARSGRRQGGSLICFRSEGRVRTASNHCCTQPEAARQRAGAIVLLESSATSCSHYV